MASLFSNSLKTVCLYFPKPFVQQTGQLHQIASRLTALPNRPVQEILSGSSVIPCGYMSPPALVGCGWFTQSIRHKIRDYYPKPRENKRHQYTWWARMKTRGGRMILMRRLIKGRHILAQPL